MLFNPIKDRESYLREGAYALKSLVSGLRSSYELGDPLGNMAASHIKNVIGCWLVGLHNEIAPVIPRSIEWLNIAIAQDEYGDRPKPSFHRSTLHEAKALALWLQSGDAAVEMWEKTRQFNLLAIADGAWGNKTKTDGLNDYLCYCIQAEQYQAGIDEFEKYHGAKKVSLGGTLAPRTYGYAVCLHHVQHQFTPEALFNAGRKMLQANLEDHPWLGYGQYTRSAMWLKIVYWHNNRTLTPLETILKAYENMPNVPRPSFV